MPKWWWGDRRVVDWGEKAVGAVEGLEKVVVYGSLEMMASRAASATVSPPRWGVVAGLRPSSDMVGTAKSLLGPEREL